MNRPERRCEVLIVGGGPTGLFLAVLLAARGVDVRVLERRREVSAHSRAIGLHPPALAALAAVGLHEAAVRQGTQIYCGRARAREGDLGQVRFGRAWPERPYVLSMPQSRTELLLEERLAALDPLPCTAVGKSRRYPPTMAAWRSPRVRTAPPFPVCGYGQASWSGPMGRAAGCVSCSRSAPRAPSIRTPISWAISPILPTARGTPPVRARRSSISSPTVWWSPSRCPTGAVAGSYTPV